MTGVPRTQTNEHMIGVPRTQTNEYVIGVQATGVPQSVEEELEWVWTKRIPLADGLGTNQLLGVLVLLG